MTQPTSQAIQQAREIAADSWPKGGTMHRMLLAGKLDSTEPVQIALRALSVSASEREAMEARIATLETMAREVIRISSDQQSDKLYTNDANGWEAAMDDAGNAARAALNGAKRP